MYMVVRMGISGTSEKLNIGIKVKATFDGHIGSTL